MLDPLQVLDRSQIRCPHCELTQWRSLTGKCRRCSKDVPYPSRIETTTVVMMVAPAPVSCEVVSMRIVMQRAAVHAVKNIGATTKAASVLGISHKRLKQLLRESGDQTNYRSYRPRKVTK